MLGRKRPGVSSLEPASQRREKDALERLRKEAGERLEEAKRREAALERRLAQVGEGGLEPDPEILRGLEERSLELDRRAQELAERERSLNERERSLADREAVADGPAELERVLADIERRHEELAQAEQLFLRTRQELLDRSDAIAAREEELLLWQRELEAGGANPGVFLPPIDEDADEEPRAARRAPAAPGFSSGLRDLQRRGTRRRSRLR